MQTFAFTGPRTLTPEQSDQARRIILSLPHKAVWLIGCAGGLDAIARDLAPRPYVLFAAASRKPWELQARSKRMVDALAAAGGTLHAFPNKPCPVELSRDRWAGSGTWGTVLYAHSLGCRIELHPLAEIEIPNWLQQKQLSLF
jgi:hypothetical protein